MSAYSALIQADTGCQAEDLAKVEVVMRDFVVGRPLDGLSRAEFRGKAKEAFALLSDERAMFEEHFQKVQAVFQRRGAGSAPSPQ